MIASSAQKAIQDYSTSIQPEETKQTIDLSSALKHAEQREDTAIQRQVADLKAAGLNPILATGYNGSSSAAAVKYTDSAAETSLAESASRQATSAEKNATANLINAFSNIFTSAFKLLK